MEAAHVSVRLSTLGLAVRAGKTVCGTQKVCEALKAKNVCAVIEARGNAENTSKRLHDRCAYYGTPIFSCMADAAELGEAIGKGPTAAVGITDRSLATAILGKNF